MSKGYRGMDRTPVRSLSRGLTTIENRPGYMLVPDPAVAAVAAAAAHESALAEGEHDDEHERSPSNSTPTTSCFLL